MNIEKKKLHYFLLVTLVIGLGAAPIVQAAAARAKKERLAREERMLYLSEQLGHKHYADEIEKERLEQELYELRALHELLKQQS